MTGTNGQTEAAQTEVSAEPTESTPNTASTSVDKTDDWREAFANLGKNITEGFEWMKNQNKTVVEQTTEPTSTSSEPQSNSTTDQQTRRQTNGADVVIEQPTEPKQEPMETPPVPLSRQERRKKRIRLFKQQ